MCDPRNEPARQACNVYKNACGNQIDYSGQQQLVIALLGQHRFLHFIQRVKMIETHISWVLIAGKYAYKIKKALNLGFLDFTDLQARQFYCNEELRLNRRLAPEIYIDVIPIGGKPENPILNALPAIEYAVRMHSFDPEDQLDHLLDQGRVQLRHFENLAFMLADFHSRLPSITSDSMHGDTSAIHTTIAQNSEQLLALLSDQKDINYVVTLNQAIEMSYRDCAEIMRRRYLLGSVRECHGDLHSGNIVLIDDKLIPFDGIEFDPALRWIDVIDEVAFLVMDLLHAQRPDLAFRFLNTYLEATGDYAGVSVLRFFISYRAMVRAKIFAIRALQANQQENIQPVKMADCRSYLALAADNLTRQCPCLIITHGLPGSGKTTFAQAATERFHAIHIRSDVERKRLAGLKPLDRSSAIQHTDIYSAEISKQTYARLHDLAHTILTAGYSVIVDATFLKKDERKRFNKLAEKMSLPFAIISIQAGDAELRSRITLRNTKKNDASEADIEVLKRLQTTQDQLHPEELVKTIEFQNTNTSDKIYDDANDWNKLDKLLTAQAINLPKILQHTLG